jgi:ribosome-associated protein
LEEASHVPEVRKPTKPTYASKQRRLQGKAIRSEVKASRRKTVDD